MNKDRQSYAAGAAKEVPAWVHKPDTSVAHSGILKQSDDWTILTLGVLPQVYDQYCSWRLQNSISLLETRLRYLKEITYR